MQSSLGLGEKGNMTVKMRNKGPIKFENKVTMRKRGLLANQLAKIKP